MVWTFFRRAIQLVLQNKKIIVIFYIATFLLGLIVALPVRTAFQAQLGHSLLGKQLVSGLNLDALIEVIRYQPNFLPMVVTVIVFSLVLWFPIQLLLVTGAITTYAKREKYVARNFWGTATDLFFPVVRLGIWWLPIAGILVAGPHYFIKGMVWVIFGKLPYQNIAYFFGKVQGFLRQIGLIVALLILHYARVHLVVQRNRVARQSLVQGLRLVTANFGITFVFALVIFFAGLIFLIIYNKIAGWLTFSHVISVILLFLWQQVYIFVRQGLLLTGTAGEILIFQRFAPRMKN